ncbi:MAG: PilZ domain-containing protein [Bdellovibrionales bacterium]|nr:PilZ domain-containing protein [Bdellovibrionales bacterium]
MAPEGTVWFLHIAGAAFGPVDTKTVVTMLQQNRVQFVDFIFTEAFSDWERICDIDIFADLLPAKPEAPPPSAPKVKVPAAEPLVTEASSATEAPKSAPARERARVRRHTQLAFRAKVSLEGIGDFRAVNIREGGVMLESRDPPAVGTEVRLSVPLPGAGESLEMTGLVIRHTSGKETPGFAVEFTRINPAHLKLIRAFLESPEK